MGKAKSLSFGIQRDSLRRRHSERRTSASTGGSKVFLVLSCTAGLLLVVSLLALSVAVNKGRRPFDFRRRGFKEFSVKEQGGIVTVSKGNSSTNTHGSLPEGLTPTESDEFKTIARTGRAMSGEDETNDARLWRARVMTGGRTTRFFYPTWSTTLDDVNPSGSPEFAAVPGLPHYGDQYAQLETYKKLGVRPQSIKNIVDYVMADPSSENRYQAPGVKIVGVYVKAPFAEDPSTKTPFNGHAYSPDPFKYYKPAHPSEINHLATSPPDGDKRYRFSNKMPGRFPSHTGDNKGLTEAIFHPYDTVATSVPRSTTPTPISSKRPLKILLDIYPVPQTESPEHEHSTRIRPTSHAPLASTPSPIPGGGRMIVHLNLFPKKIKNRKIPTTTSHSLMSSETSGPAPGRGYSHLRNFQDRNFVYSAILRRNTSLPHQKNNDNRTSQFPDTVGSTTSESGSIHGHPSPDISSPDSEPPNLLSTAINDDLGGIMPRNGVEDYELDTGQGERGSDGARNSTDSPLVIDTEGGGLQIETSTYVDDSLRRDLFNLQATASSVDSSMDFEQEYSFETSVDTPVSA